MKIKGRSIESCRFDNFISEEKIELIFVLNKAKKNVDTLKVTAVSFCITTLRNDLKFKCLYRDTFAECPCKNNCIMRIVF